MTISKTCLSLAAAYLMVSSIANADTITASLFTPLPPAGVSPTLLSLSRIPTPSQSTITTSAYSISFSTAADQGVVQGTNPGHAEPVAGVSGATPEYLTGDFGSSLTTNIADSGNYLSTGTGTITITFSTPESSLALLWGSIDTGNSLRFSDGFTVTGTMVQQAAAGFAGYGFQGPGGSAYVVVDTTTPFTSVTATSTTVSFEFANITTADAPFTTTPEPPTNVVLGLGLIVVAVVVRRRIVTT
jgi:hypothetical protein